MTSNISFRFSSCLCRKNQRRKKRRKRTKSSLHLV